MMQSTEQTPRTRYYNRIEIDKQNGVVTKTSDTQRFRDEVKYYQSLPKDLRIFFPRLIDWGETDGGLSAQFEYYPYETIYQYFSNPNVEMGTFFKIAKQLSYILQKFSEYKAPERYSYTQSMREMYLDKTIDEYTNLVNNNQFFKDLALEKTLWINGVKCDNFSQIGDRIRLAVGRLIENAPPAQVIHGDYCFGNILVSHKDTQIKLIDPRGSYGEVGCFGDPRYDWAKLYHSFDGCYEHIINDNFSVSANGNKIHYEIVGTKQDFLSECLKKNMPFHITEHECRLIQGLIYIGMCHRHKDSLERQKIMYATGTKILNEVL